MKRYIILLLLFPFFITCSQKDQSVVIATSAWTAAYARAAGVPEVIVLAPPGMQHPTEYELEIDDIRNIRNARLIITGGYEIMMEKIRSGLKVEPDRILQITTDYDFDHMQESILKIAEQFNTQQQAMASIKEIEKAFMESRRKFEEAGLYDETYLVQYFLRSYAGEMGLNIVDTFGPAHLEVFDIQDIMEKDFSMILDNEHNPVAGPIISSKEDVNIAYLINFPGSHGTNTLVDVIIYNTDRILEVQNSQIEN